MEVTIRLVGRDDITLLDNVDNDVFDHVVRREFSEPFLADPNNVLIVAMVDDIVIGMASGICYVHPDKPRQLFINEVGVAESYQRRGIGRQLVEAILREGDSRGCTEAWVATEEGNTAARALYSATSGHEDPQKAVVFTWRIGDGAI